MSCFIIENGSYNYTGNNGIEYKKKGMYFKNKEALPKLIKYILRQRLDEDRGGELVAYTAFGIDLNMPIEDIISQMQMVQDHYCNNGDYGRRAYHFVLTFSDAEIAAMGHSYQSVMNIGLEIGVYFWTSGFQNIIAIHNDPTKRIHIHFAVNSFNYLTGYKFHIDKDMKEELKTMSMNICKSHLPICDEPVIEYYNDNININDSNYYGISGENGFGFYNNKYYLERAKTYIDNPQVMLFNSAIEAFAWASGEYNKLQFGVDMDSLFEGSFESFKPNWIKFRNEIVKDNESMHIGYYYKR